MSKKYKRKKDKLPYDVLAFGTLMERKINLKSYCHFLKSPDSGFWDKQNRILYDLCQKYYPGHKKADGVAAKLLLIGRAYSASLERMKKRKKKGSVDDFYKKIAEKCADFDLELKKIPKGKKRLMDRNDNIIMICEVHFKLINLFHSFTDQYNISFASKYLHFHRPIVPIYDSRAVKNISKIVSQDSEEFREYKKKMGKFKKNSKYFNFIIKMAFLQNELFRGKCKCSARDIDKYLLRPQKGK